MKKIVLLVLLTCCFCKQRNPDGENVVLQPREFQEKLAATPGAMLLDVRTFREVKEECIKGETNFDIQGDGFKMLIQGLDKSKPYFVYCASGGRSSRAADMMKELNFTKVYTLDGGLKAWKAAGLPTKK